MPQVSRKLAHIAWGEVVLYALLFALLFLALPWGRLGASHGALRLDVSLPLSITVFGGSYQLLQLPVVLLGGAMIWWMSEVYLLLTKQERRIALLLYYAFSLSFPLSSLLGLGVQVLYIILRHLSFAAYQETDTSRLQLLLGFVVGSLSLFVLDYLLLLLVFLLGLYTLRALALRPALSLFFGFVLPAWLMGALFLYAVPEQVAMLPAYFQRQAEHFLPLGALHLDQALWPYLLLSLLLGLLSVLLYRRRYYTESVRHRDMTLTLQNDACLFALVAVLLPNTMELLFPLSLPALALLFARGGSNLPRRFALVLRSLLLIALLLCLVVQRFGWEQLISFFQS